MAQIQAGGGGVGLGDSMDEDIKAAQVAITMNGKDLDRGNLLAFELKKISVRQLVYQCTNLLSESFVVDFTVNNT